jgi:hypothetical protein
VARSLLTQFVLNVAALLNLRPRIRKRVPAFLAMSKQISYYAPQRTFAVGGGLPGPVRIQKKSSGGGTHLVGQRNVADIEVIPEMKGERSLRKRLPKKGSKDGASREGFIESLLDDDSSDFLLRLRFDCLFIGNVAPMEWLHVPILSVNIFTTKLPTSRCCVF